VRNQEQALCCVATHDYLPGAIAFYRSVLEHQDLPLVLMAADCDPEETAALEQRICDFLPERARANLRVVSPVDIYGGSTRQMRYYYDAFEFSTACKSAVLAWIERNTTFDRWLYVDSDMLCFASLAPLFAQLDAQSILLTPHRTGPGSALNEDLLLLSSGAFNAGVLGIRRSSTSRAFAAWYLDVLSFYCVNDPPLPWADRVSQSAVIFVDQRWLDLVPACFPEVVVARDRSVNLGHWNVGHDTIEWRDRRLFIGEDRVLLLHLSGWREDQPHRLSRHSPLDWSHCAAWADVHASYRAATSLLRPHFSAPYRFHAYPDGTAIPRAHRRRYLQHLLAGGRPVDDPLTLQAAFNSATTRPGAAASYWWT
jgi:hypothetical protein